jgi:hypothetical protein
LRRKLSLGYTELEELSVSCGETTSSAHLGKNDLLLEKLSLVLCVLLGVLPEALVLDQGHVGAIARQLWRAIGIGQEKLTATSSETLTSCPRIEQVPSTYAIAMARSAVDRSLGKVSLMILELRLQMSRKTRTYTRIISKFPFQEEMQRKTYGIREGCGRE